MLFVNRFGNSLAGATSPPATDPMWNYVILLLKGENTNGSSTILDSGPLALSHGTNVGVTNSTAEKKWNNGSLYNTGNSHRIEYAASANRWNFAVDYWTFECWVMLPNGFDGYGVCQITKGSSDRGNFYIDSTYMQVYTGSGSYQAAHGGMTAGVWYHVAWTKASGVNLPKMFINGTELTVVNTRTWSSVTQGYQIGRNDGGTHSTKYLDDLRITKGSVAGCQRYTSSFTPPTAPFPTSGP